MEFAFFKIISDVDKPIIDYVINITGMIIIPIVVYLLSSVYAVRQNDRKNKIQSLNNLTLYCKNLLQECLKLKNNEARRRKGLLTFIGNPSSENFVKAFYIVRTPSLQYELYANDFAFTTIQYCQMVDLIFEVNSNLKTVLTFITEFNMQSDLARQKSRDEQIKLANELLLQLDSFHHNCNILSFLIGKLLYAIQIYNSYFFHQDIINLQFTGQMNELLNEANNELAEAYKNKEHNWFNVFIENLENPTVNLKFKDFLNVIFLKVTGNLDKWLKKIKKEVYKIKKDKFIQQQRNAKTLCTEPKIEELNKRFKNVLNNYNTCKEEFNSLEILDDNLSVYLYKNLLKRLDSIIIAFKNIIEILPPDRKLLLTTDEISQIMINVNHMISNFIPTLNTIFKFLLLFINKDANIDSISFLSPELNNIVDEDYKKDLEALSNSQIYKFIENCDYAYSNGIPYELTSMSGSINDKYVGIQIVASDKPINDELNNIYLYDLIFLIAEKLIKVSRDAHKTILKNKIN